MLLEKKHIWYLIILIPVITFFTAFFIYSVNAPINDDYAILDFINKCIATDSISEKISLIFAQHNEHRIVYDRFWTILIYKLNGTVDFNLMALIGNLSLVGIALLFLKKFKNLNKEIALFLPITIIIFNLTSWENITFAMATLSNFTVLFFVLLSLYYFALNTVEHKKNVILGTLFFVLAVLTQGGGLFVFPMVILILLFKKEYKNILLFLVIGIPTLLLYFINYTAPSGNLGLIPTVIKYNYEIILFVFAFIGNAASFFLIYSDTLKISTNTSIVFGMILCILFVYISYKKYYRKNPFVYSILLYFIISACITSVSRIPNGVELAVSSRYRINGIIFLAAIYFWIIETYTIKKIHFYLIMFISTLYFVMTLKQSEYLDVRRKQTYTGILLYNIGNSSFLNGKKEDTPIYTTLITNSKKAETYSLPSNEEILEYFPYSYEHLPLELKSGKNLSYSVDTITELNDSYLIDGWAFMESESTRNQKVYIGVTNNGNTVYYSTKQYSRYELNPFFKKFNLGSGGYIARIRKNDLNPGQNLISLLIEVNGSKNTILTDKKIIK